MPRARADLLPARPAACAAWKRGRARGGGINGRAI
nr:MAG TPA: hypothetical protein [Caudoviricetes sp.]